MKTCYYCKVEKSLADFHNNRSRSDGKQIGCKDCYRQIQRLHYKNSSTRREKVRSTRSLAKDVIVKFLRTYLENHPCADCGETDLLVLEFDHVRDVKLHNIGDLLRKRVSLDMVKQEVEKCEVRCANCHRRRTATLNNSWRLPR